MTRKGRKNAIIANSTLTHAYFETFEYGMAENDSNNRNYNYKRQKLVCGRRLGGGGCRETVCLQIWYTNGMCDSKINNCQLP